MTEAAAREVLTIQRDSTLRDQFIEAHRHFILARACKEAGHYVTDQDDEYSIAMIAFNEAIDAYEEEKGEFYALATVVIHRRLCDYLRSQYRFAGEIATEPFVLSGGMDDDAPEKGLHMEVMRREAELSEQDVSSRPEGNPVKDEIEAVQQILKRYGFTFFDLADCSPKAEKTKKACATAVAFLLGRKDLLRRMRQSCTLPGKEILEETGISRKILERHRKYIIAAAEILNGEYPLLAEYMSYIRQTMGT